MKLTALGWSEFFEKQITKAEASLSPARVFRQDTNQYHLISEYGKLIGALPGKIRQKANSKADLPTVGDWVLTSPIRGDETNRAQIERILTRQSKFSRKEAGDIHDEQVVAANIDTVFIVSALDQDFNLHRIERYLLLSWTSGALPVLILNKSDLCNDIEKKVKELRTISMDSPIHVISAEEESGIASIKQYIGFGLTCAFLGSSGVGKSTIINTLLGYKKFDTGEVRTGDSRGRHTTTFREMVNSFDGGMIIDTPGMRELQLWAGNVSLSHSFGDIESLAKTCKFSDCKHVKEPGCSIKEAIRSENLAPERLARYFRLTNELKYSSQQQKHKTNLRRKRRYKRTEKQ